MKRKATALALILAMILSLVSGCGSLAGEEPAAKTEAATPSQSAAAPTQSAAVESTDAVTASPEPAGERTKLTIALWETNPDFLTGDDKVYRKVQDKLNIEIEPIVITWDDYKDKLNTWAASSELPDLFAIDAIGSKTFFNWADGEIIRALPTDFGKYPQLANLFKQPDIIATKYKDKFYALPRPTGPNISPHMWAYSRACYIRTDWLKKLNIPMPETFPQFHDALKAIQAGDPEGNGKPVTGLVTYDTGFLAFVTLAFCPASADSWIKDETDGKIRQAFYTPSYVDALKALRSLYKDGILDKDFAIQKTEEGLAKFANGLAAAACFQLTSPLADYMGFFGNTFQKAFPNKKLAESIGFVPPLKNEKDGKRTVFTYPGFWSESYISAAVDDAKMDKILQLVDYTLSPEFLEIQRYGLEGVDFTKSGDKYTIIREKDATGTFIPLQDKYKFLAGFKFLGTWAGDTLPEDPAVPADVNKICNDYLSWVPQNTVVPTVYFDPVFMSLPLKNEWTADIGADTIQIIIGKEPVEDMYKKVIDGYKAKGLDAMVDEVNAALAAKGIK